MLCKSCGKELSGRFCEYCGAQSDTAAPAPEPVFNISTGKYEINSKNNSRTLLITVIAVACAAVIAAGIFAYLYFSRKSKAESEDNGRKSSVSSSQSVKNDTDKTEKQIEENSVITEKRSEPDYGCMKGSVSEHNGMVTGTVYENETLGIGIRAEERSEIWFYKTPKNICGSDNEADSRIKSLKNLGVEELCIPFSVTDKPLYMYTVRLSDVDEEEKFISEFIKNISERQVSDVRTETVSLEGKMFHSVSYKRDFSGVKAEERALYRFEGNILYFFNFVDDKTVSWFYSVD